MPAEQAIHVLPAREAAVVGDVPAGITLAPWMAVILGWPGSNHTSPPLVAGARQEN
jgi:hypothetical protein